MSDKKKQTEDPEELIESAIDSTEGFLEKNRKQLLIGLGVVVLVACAIFAYTTLVSEPREYKASSEMFVAEQMFAADSFAVALNGSEFAKGFIDIANDYSSSSVGNTANHYAGVCYIKLGDFENAITYLEKYNKVDGIAAEIVNAQNLGLQGDANVQLNELSLALNKFEDAANISNNDFTTPMYLKKAGIVAEKLDQKEKALELYTAVKNQYPTSLEGRDIDKYIGRVSQ